MKNTEHKTLFAFPRLSALAHVLNGKPVSTFPGHALIVSAAFFGLLWLAGVNPTPAAAQGTPQQQQACSGDAQRLCGQYIPDVAKISACMSHYRAYLSPACRAAISPPSSHGHGTHHHHHA